MSDVPMRSRLLLLRPHKPIIGRSNSIRRFPVLDLHEIDLTILSNSQYFTHVWKHRQIDDWDKKDG